MFENRRRLSRYARLAALVLLPAISVACGDKDKSGSNNGTPNGSQNGANTAYPKVTPPVKQAAPNAFKGATTRSIARSLYDGPGSLDANAFISRFFSAGPTELFNVLGGIDASVEGILMQAANSNQPCLTQEPVAYELAVPGGNVTMYAQCKESQTAQYQGDPAFVQWAAKDGNFYIYSAIGVGWTAAIVTPHAAVDGNGNVSVNANATVTADANAQTGDTNQTTVAGDGNATVNSAADANASLDPNAYTVHAWYSVGLNNFTVTTPGMLGTGWFNGSYCIAEIYADPQSHRFEMTAAGGGIGFCGAQFASDGNDVFGIGSTDMAITCNPTATVCLDANTGAAKNNCSLDQNSFTLPPLGRQGMAISPNTMWAASDYPGEPNNMVVLDGTAHDSAHFGPGEALPTAGTFAPKVAGGNVNVNGNANVNVSGNGNVNLP